MFFSKRRKKRLFAVIGLGGFGTYVAKRLSELGAEVIAIDEREERAKTLSEELEHVYILDATDERALKEVGVAEADVAIVSVGERVDASAIIVMNLQKLGVKEIIAKAVTEVHARLLSRLGVSSVIHPEREVALRLAKTLVKPSVLEELVLSDELTITELEPPKEFFDKSLKELDLRKRYGINVVAVKRTNRWEAPPDPDEPILEGDRLLVIGSRESVEKLESLLEE